MNAQAPINLRPVLTHAIAFSLIPCNRPLTEKERRAVFPLLDRYEQEIAAAWRAELFADGNTHVSQEVSALLAAQRKDASERAAAANRAKRAARKAKIIECLSQGAMQRADLQGMIALSDAAMKKLLCEMVNEGTIVMTPIAGRRRQFVYEVAQ